MHCGKLIPLLITSYPQLIYSQLVRSVSFKASFGTGIFQSKLCNILILKDKKSREKTSKSSFNQWITLHRLRRIALSQKQKQKQKQKQLQASTKW